MFQYLMVSVRYGSQIAVCSEAGYTSRTSSGGWKSEVERTQENVVILKEYDDTKGQFTFNRINYLCC